MKRKSGKITETKAIKQAIGNIALRRPAWGDHSITEKTGTDPVEAARQTAEKLFEDARGSHDWEHTLRVCRLCRHVGAVEGAEMDVLLIAAYLHDIGRCYQDQSGGVICHAQKGAEMAAGIVSRLDLTEEKQKNIIHCVQAHRFRNDHLPLTIEAKVLFDADKLDAIGAVGIARAYLFAGELGARLHNPDISAIETTRPYTKDDTGYREYRLKLCRIKDTMQTAEGRRIAAGRHEFMEAFFKRFLEEYDGKL